MDCNNIVIDLTEDNEQNEVIDLSGNDTDNDDTLEESVPVVNLDGVKTINNPKNIWKIFPKHKRNTVGILTFLENKKENHIVNLNLYKKGYVLHAHHLVTLLTPKTWLIDVVIQNYILLLVKQCVQKLQILCTDYLEAFKKDQDKAVTDWLRNKKIVNLNIYNKILIIINPNNNHWALFVANPKNRTIYSLDSLNGSNTNEYELVSKFLTMAYEKTQMNLTVSETSFEWKLLPLKSPIQTNGYDCGVFACTNARYYLLNKKFEYTEKDTRLLRQRIAFELINNKIVKDYATPLNYYVN